MSNNPHLDMANDVFARMFGLPKIPTPDPLSADEAEHGVCAMADWESESELKGAHDDDRR